MDLSSNLFQVRRINHKSLHLFCQKTAIPGSFTFYDHFPVYLCICKHFRCPSFLRLLPVRTPCITEKTANTEAPMISKMVPQQIALYANASLWFPHNPYQILANSSGWVCHTIIPFISAVDAGRGGREGQGGRGRGTWGTCRTWGTWGTSRTWGTWDVGDVVVRDVLRVI